MSVDRFYVYIHMRPDTGRVFYVGKGADRKNRPHCRERAKDASNRNQHWKNIVAKSGGFESEVVATYQTNEEALSAEIRLIKFFGKENLANMTDGGQGIIGLPASPELRRKRSINSSRPRSQAFKDSVRRARKNGGNGGVVKKGDKLPDWWRDRISNAVKGEKNSMYGRTGAKHPNSRAVICTVTGKRYASVTEAAEARGMKMKTLYNVLTGHRENKTGLILEPKNAA